MAYSLTATVPLDTVVRDTRPVYPQPCYWESTVEYIKGDELEWETVRELIAVLERGESFREPVYIGLAENAEFDTGNPSAYVSDGTHRMVAHIVYGSPTVDVVYEVSDIEDDSDDESAEYEGGTYRVLCTTVEFADETSDDRSDEVFNVLRSFKVSDDLWVTSDVMSSRGSKFEFTWNVTDGDEELVAAINDICVERIAKHLAVKPIEVKTYFDEWDDSE